jgi:hypothetical protein
MAKCPLRSVGRTLGGSSVLVACVLVLAGCGSSAPQDLTGTTMTSSQLKAAQGALNLLQRTQIPSRVVAISFQQGTAPTTCSVLPNSVNEGDFKLYVAWASSEPGYTTVPKSVLFATITPQSPSQDRFQVFTFRNRYGKPEPLSVQVNANLERAALSKPSAQCQVLENGHLQLLSTQ